MKRILIVGAVGQIGSELTMELRNHFGSENVVAGGRKTAPSDDLLNSGPFAFMDVADRNSLREVAEKYEIDTIINMLQSCRQQ
jgi:dTDP-4-dehydrorhamnose reductase